MSDTEAAKAAESPEPAKAKRKARTKTKPSGPAGLPQLRTPMEWCVRLGHFNVERLPSMKQEKRAKWYHNSAAAIHGWNLHDAGGDPMQLTQEDYEAALEVVQGAPPYMPHGGALSPYKRGK